MPKPSSIRSAVSIEHRLVTDGHRPMASTADAQHRAVESRSLFTLDRDVVSRGKRA